MIKQGFLFNRISLRLRVFVSLIIIILFTVGTLGFLMFLHFKQTAETFHKNRLLRKEKTIIETIDYAITDYPEEVDERNITDVLKPKIFEFSDINDIHINLYDLKGNLMLTSEAKIPEERKRVPAQIMSILSMTNDRVEHILTYDKETYITVYTYLYNINQKPIAILSLPYMHDDSFQKQEFFLLIERFLAVVAFVIFIGGLIAWWLSKSVTARIKEIAERLNQTHVVGHNRPIFYDSNDEVKVLVDSYNEMVLKLNEQSEQLLKIEREETWREAARQVAHELKNPLTPMRLQIQNFNRKFEAGNPDNKEKVDELCKGLLKQIDTITGIAEAFSDFAKMPVRKDESIDIVEEISLALEMFDEKFVKYTPEIESPLYIDFDSSYLVRVITNLVKNALQAVPFGRTPEVEVKIRENNGNVNILVSDNGTGISDELIDRIFEPKFTTKSSGSGFGLVMVKKIVEEYGGNIRFRNNSHEGATFIISLPLTQKNH
ncbi:ATP-binding protein [Ornithobacterium rhinotracheale]|uniref:sensor histidine kinase n=1 Tax=Ornithobacterium rhinotracheale TaxID=28251 RepID=UPI0039FC3CEF